MRMRIVAVLATVAALTGAPSFASGAGNSLASPIASPTTGTVATIFTLRVNYDGKSPATEVTVSVAGRMMPLARVEGTATRGTWSVDTVLLAGTWTPTFSALPASGNAPTIAGPTVTVAGLPAIAVTPAPTVTNLPSSAGSETEDEAPGGGGDPVGSILPDPAPAPPDVEASPSADDAPASVVPVTPKPGPSGAGPGSGPEPSVGGSSRTMGSPAPDAPDGGGSGAAPAAPPETEPGTRPSAAPGAMPASDRAPDDDPDAGVADDTTLGIVLLLGLSGVATVAIIGTTLLVVGRRRAQDDEVPAAVAGLSDADSLLERRTVRQAKVRLSEDPIVTAMGVDDHVAARRSRTSGAREVRSGPGERSGGGR